MSSVYRFANHLETESAISDAAQIIEWQWVADISIEILLLERFFLMKSDRRLVRCGTFPCSSPRAFKEDGHVSSEPEARRKDRHW
jgi:hypothetical protein